MIEWIKQEKILRIFLLVSVLLAGVYFFGVKDMEVESIFDYRPKSYLLSAVIVVSLHVMKTFFVFLPLKAIFLLSGVLLPLPAALAASYVGLFAEIKLGYAIGKRYGSKRMMGLIERYPRAKNLLEQRKNRMKQVLFLSRVVPGLPVDVVSMFFGATRVDQQEYERYSLLGFTPFLWSLAVMGNAAEDPLSFAFIAPLVIMAGIVALAYLLYKRWTRIEK
ncbi:MAG TPA: hypothetical protein DHN33_03800 [Eubacteriaceae bacterium]|nr:hypothetical protein [Eubacteriaceae bacterium]